MEIELGGIYKTEFDERPFRIIGLDEIEVFYDCLWSNDKWTFSGNFKRKCYFYRMSAEMFAKKSKQTDTLILTESEFKAFRPDLPIRLGRTKLINWNKFDHVEYSEFRDFINSDQANFFTNLKVETPEIVLIPYGKKGGLGKGVKVSSDNGEFFDTAEIIWKAKEIQESENESVSDGIGIYRIGFEKGLPSYYIGEYFDRAGLFKQ